MNKKILFLVNIILNIRILNDEINFNQFISSMKNIVEANKDDFNYVDDLISNIQFIEDENNLNINNEVIYNKYTQDSNKDIEYKIKDEMFSVDFNKSKSSSFDLKSRILDINGVKYNLKNKLITLESEVNFSYDIKQNTLKVSKQDNGLHSKYSSITYEIKDNKVIEKQETNSINNENINNFNRNNEIENILKISENGVITIEFNSYLDIIITSENNIKFIIKYNKNTIYKYEFNNDNFDIYIIDKIIKYQYSDNGYDKSEEKQYNRLCYKIFLGISVELNNFDNRYKIKNNEITFIKDNNKYSMNTGRHNYDYIESNPDTITWKTNNEELIFDRKTFKKKI